MILKGSQPVAGGLAKSTTGYKLGTLRVAICG